MRQLFSFNYFDIALRTETLFYMKNILITLCLFAVLMMLGTFVFTRVSQAQNNSVTADLLNLPAPPPPNPLNEKIVRGRKANFYNKNNVPSDDAPIEDLLDYWRFQNDSYNQTGYNVPPSDRSLERILAAIEKNPETLVRYLNILPDKSEATDFVKRLYDRELDSDDSENYRAEGIKQWLTNHSDYFSDDLLKNAQQVADTGEYVTNQEALLSLGRVNWEKAQPIVDRLYNDRSQPVAQVLANWILYKHALDTNSLGDIEKYRAELKAMVENKSAKPGMRDLAMDALSHTPDFDGRDDWYFSLLGDETLGDLRVNGQSYTGLTTLIAASPPDKYAAKMLEILKSGNPAARNAAVRNLAALLNQKNPEIIRTLVPWLEDPKWAKEVGGERQQLVSVLQNIAIPESVPGLIAVLNEKSSRTSPPLNDGNSNLSPDLKINANIMNSNMMIDYGAEREEYPFRNAAISALAVQKDARAVPALRSVMTEIEFWQQGNVVRALLASGGFSIPEQTEALEAVAQSVGSMSGGGKMTNANIPPDMRMESNMAMAESVNMLNMNISTKDYMAPRRYNPAEVKFTLGIQLLSTTDVSDELVTAVVERIGELEKKDKSLAFALRKVIQRWNGAGVNLLLLKDLKNGRADMDEIVKLLSLRKELREKQPNEIYDARSGGNPAALGIVPCLLENNSEYDAVLNSGSVEVKTTMFACARLIRARLPLGKVAENLQSPIKLLAQAAESYLESEDSPEAQALVFSANPNKAKILGATTAFTSETGSPTISNFLDELFVSVDDSFGFLMYLAYDGGEKFGENEKKLQKEVQGNQEILGVYSYDGNFIRIYKDKAVFSWEEDAARYNERTLTESEFNTVKDYLASQRVNELAPFLAACEECQSKELLMLGRQGGRRIFMRSSSPPDFFAELDRLFAKLRTPPARLHYRLEKDVAGLEIMFADKNFQAQTLWKNGEDFRLLIDDTQRHKQIDKELQRQYEADAEKEDTDYEKVEEINRKRRAQREFESLAWYQVGREKLGGTVAAPPQIEFLPVRDGASVLATSEQWKARTPNFEIRADAEGLYKYSRGRMTKILSGYYEQPLVTPNGRWAIATKFSEEDGPESSLVRVNLLTNKEFKINIRQYPGLNAVAFVNSINKVLVWGHTYEYDYKEKASKIGDYYLLDAETGIIETAKGDVRPLAQQTFRPLQPSGGANEFWAAIPDVKKNQTQIGIYDAKNFIFKTRLELPQIAFDSMDLWADDAENKIYFVYKGQLLGLTLTQKQNKSVAVLKIKQ